MPFQFDVYDKKIHVLPGTDYIDAMEIINSYQKWLSDYPDSRNADAIMDLTGGIRTVGDQLTPIILVLEPDVKIVLNTPEMQGLILPLNNQIISKTDGLNFWEIDGNGMAVVPGYGNITTIAQKGYDNTVDTEDTASEPFNPDVLFAHAKWRELMAKLNSAQATVNISTSDLSIKGLTEQNITITQGEDWELDVVYDAPEGSVIEFLLQDTSRQKDPIAGSFSIKDNGFVLFLSSQQTSGFLSDEYFYNVSYVLGESKNQILRGVARIQHSVLPV